MVKKNKYQEYFAANKSNWNKRVSVHINSEFYNAKKFLSDKNSLNNIELDELGDITGKSVLHLQCHFGQDTLSLANLGAEVTGVDFSENAIQEANSLAKEIDIKAKFICSNIYDLKEKLDEKFDIVFTSYGTIGWLPDINKWANIVSHFLKPGGKFLIADFHPFIWMFDDNFEKFQYSYFHDEAPIEEILEETYTDGDSKINLKQFSWNHPLSDVTNSLINNGLDIISLKEYNYSPYNCFPDMIEIQNGKFVFEKYGGKLPLVYSIKASKK